MDAVLLQKYEEMSARVVALEMENRLLRQKLDQYIRHYFGGQHNEDWIKSTGTPAPRFAQRHRVATPESKATTATRSGTHPVRRMLAEDKLETYETVIEPEEVKGIRGLKRSAKNAPVYSTGLP